MVSMLASIQSCAQCPHYTNSSREHNDAFTSEPFPVRHYCEYGKSRGISGEGIDRDCPLPLADEIDRLRADLAALKDPVKVLVNMMRGNIATPTPYALAGLFGENLTDLDSANLRIAELRQSLKVRDTEIARLQTDLELARAQISELREQVAQLCGYDSAQEMDADR